VLSTEVGDKVTVIDNVDFTKAISTDARNNQKAVDITSNGVIDFAGYAQGVYTLDVVVDDDRAYEGIVIIGEQPQSNIENVVKKVNTEKYFVDIIIEEEKKKQKHSICFFDPSDKECDPIDGKCPEGFGMNEEDRCVPTGDCPDGYGRADEDQTGTCYDEDDELVTCEDGSIRLPQYCRENEDGDGDESEKWIEFCEKNPNVIPCNHNDLPTPEPQPVYDCTNGVLPWCVPVDDDDKDDEYIVDPLEDAYEPPRELQDQDQDQEEKEEEKEVDGQGEESGGSDSEDSEESGGSEGETSE
jgi:hypothetical protein